MKKCINCGKLLDDGAKFCTECGLSDFTQVFNEISDPDNTETVRLTSADNTNNEEFTYSPAADTKKTKEKKDKKGPKTGVVAILVIGLIVIVAIVAGNIRGAINDKRKNADYERRLAAIEEAQITESTAPAIKNEETTTATKTTEEKTTEEKTTEEKTTEEKTTAAPTTKTPETTTKKEKTTRSESDISPEFQAAMDGYEDFMDSYVEFMKNYDASDWSMLTKYSELMIEYAEWMEKIDDMDDDDMTTAEAALYVEVTGRVMGKLATVGY